MDRHDHVGRAYHGLAPVPQEERYRLYRDERVALSSPRFAWIDTLFALPEAALFAQVIELEETPGRGSTTTGSSTTSASRSTRSTPTRPSRPA